MNLLDQYLSFASVNESPPSYHLWTGLSLISHVVGRRVWTDMELFIVRPNMYIILAGPPGVAKSTAMDVAKNIVRINFKQIALSPAAITKEAMVQIMAKEDSTCIRSFDYQGKKHKFSQISVFADEIVSLLTCGGQPTMMIDFMTELFGGSDYRETTKNKGDNEIKSPFLNVLACCTIKTLRQLVQAKVVSGGMSRRCIFVVEYNNHRPVHKIHYTQQQRDAQVLFISRLEALQRIAGPFTWSPEADEFYEHWYNKNFYLAQNCKSEVTQHFLRTKPSYAIKLSMLLALCEETPTLVHTASTFSRAIDYITAVENGAASLFDAEGRNELSPIALDVERYLQRVGECNIKDLYRDFYSELKCGDTREIDNIVAHLTRSGKVTTKDLLHNNAPIRMIASASPQTENTPSP
jgi:hypothetical protein